MAGNPATHPSTETLRALVLGKLARDKTEALLSHLRSCPDCSQKASAFSDANLPATSDTSPPDWTLFHLAGPKTGGIQQQFPIPFGRYRLVKLLGKGGMGAVYLAHDTQLDRPVALKIPLFAADDGPQVLERFYREARAAATIRHAHVCPLHDVGEIDGTPYLTMAFVEGKSLSEVAATRPLTPRQAGLLVRKLALALKEAHQLGIIHRDLKPANVMIDQRGEPLIMDFGLARRTRGGDARLTKQGSILGTPAYMAPEQISGDLEGTGPASDVYSLGVIFYELLTGRLPFTGDPMAVLARVLMDEPPAPSEVRPGLDPNLEAICLEAMAKKVADRYKSMAELAAALTDALRATSLTAAPSATLTSRPVAAPTPRPAAVAAAKTETKGVHLTPLPKGKPKADKSRRPQSKRASRRRIPLWAWLSGAGMGVAILLLLLLVILWTMGLFKGKPRAGSPVLNNEPGSGDPVRQKLETRESAPNGKDLAEKDKLDKEDRTIVLENVPADASVLVDGQIVGLTRIDGMVTMTAIAEGQHRLSVVQGGKEIWSANVTVKRGDEPVRLLVDAREPAPERPVVAAPEKTPGSKPAPSIVGTWHITQPGIGESDLTIKARSDGYLDVQEKGLGNVHGTGTFSGERVLTIQWGTPNYGGYWQFALDKELKTGVGKTIWIRGKPPSGSGAKEVKGTGKMVWELEGITIRRND